ncbi:MAG TPA: biotin transporter BioY [bacterium]|nr:biotin transporter BioY [bacterium]HPN33806.1 biotin transporter BioY [bacterium]
MRPSARGTTYPLVLAALLTAMTAAGAWIRIPGPVVPITAQTLFTYLAGALLSRRQAFLSQAAYLLLGLAGVPVFALGGGLAYLMQPSFGYLFALPFAALTIAQVEHSRRAITVGRRMVSLALGSVCVFSLSAIWLYFYFDCVMKTPTSLRTLSSLWVLPFVPGEAVKIVAAAFISIALEKRMKEIVI